MAILPRFKKRHIKGCCEVALRRYYKKDKPMMLAMIYQKQYKQRKNDNQESFNKQLDKNITIKQPFDNRHTKHIKGVLIIDLEDLEEKTTKQRKKWQITILVKKLL